MYLYERLLESFIKDKCSDDIYDVVLNEIKLVYSKAKQFDNDPSFKEVQQTRRKAMAFNKSEKMIRERMENILNGLMNDDLYIEYKTLADVYEIYRKCVLGYSR